MSCGVGHRRGLDPEVLWLWPRMAATAPIGSLSWEPPCATGTVFKLRARPHTHTHTHTHTKLFSRSMSSILLTLIIIHCLPETALTAQLMVGRSLEPDFRRGRS